MHHKKEIHDKVLIGFSVAIRNESNHILQSNRDRCTDFLNMPTWAYGDTIDFLLSLHLVLEAGINGLFRELAIVSLQKTTPHVDVVNDLDQVSYSNKVTLLIYLSNFDFDKNIEQANAYRSIISEIKRFNEPRNKIVHGHSIGSYSSENKTSETYLQKSIKDDRLIKAQIRLFIHIVDGIRFYVNHINNERLSKDTREKLLDRFLSYDFIPSNFRNE